MPGKVLLIVHEPPYPVFLCSAVGVFVDVAVETSEGVTPSHSPLSLPPFHFFPFKGGIVSGYVTTTFGGIKQNAHQVVVELHGDLHSPMRDTKTDQFGRFVFLNVPTQWHIVRVITPTETEQIICFFFSVSTIFGFMVKTVLAHPTVVEFEWDRGTSTKQGVCFVCIM
jgi:hypothetical protein